MRGVFPTIEPNVAKSFGDPLTGRSPNTALIQGKDGMLYGTTKRGGISDAGTVFKLKPDGTDFTIIYNFDGVTSGGNPFGALMREPDGFPLMQAADGFLYGTTPRGGSSHRVLQCRSTGKPRGSRIEGRRPV